MWEQEDTIDLIKLIRSLEEFVFETIVLLFFYPKMLLMITFKPMQAMRYAENEEAQNKDNSYDDSVSPPLLLLITLFIANCVGLALHVPQAADASNLAKALLDSPQNLVMFRSMLFSLFPLTAAVVAVHRRGQATSRAALRPPFFAQCYLISPFALVISMGIIALQSPRPGMELAGLAACMLAFVWMVGVQAAWFRARFNCGWAKALAIGVGLLVWVCICVLAVVALLANLG